MLSARTHRLGQSAIAARVRELNTRLRHELHGTPLAPAVATPAEHGIKAAASAYGDETVRMGAGIVNSHDEIDRGARDRREPVLISLRQI